MLPGDTDIAGPKTTVGVAVVLGHIQKWKYNNKNQHKKNLNMGFEVLERKKSEGGCYPFI